LTASVASAIGASARSSASLPTFVVGYSFGARIALAALAENRLPVGVRGVCLVSCHPGLSEADTTAREARRTSDEQWARRILRLPEDELWQAWDAQPVFADSSRPSRHRGLPASRAVLAHALRTLSLSNQPDYRSFLTSNARPALWMTGADDPKFARLAMELRQAGASATFVTCASAGHRVPWDQPDEFSRLVRNWIESVSPRSAPEGHST
jgi:2-succinyl-6-hydroxy-2,4-cyclohexadiene-1-carboxylate synthase